MGCCIRKQFHDFFILHPKSLFCFRILGCKYLCCLCIRSKATVRNKRRINDETEVANDYHSEPAIWGKLISLDDSQHIIVRDNICTIGRDETVTNRINYPRISHQHCTIRKKENIFILIDESTNGTFVNKNIVGKDKEVKLNHGDELALLNQGDHYYFSYLFQIVSNAANNKIREKKDVFISYCWANKELVYKIKKDLDSNGISVWLDIDQMQGGNWLYDEIVSGISYSSVIVCFCSPEYIESRNCGIEVSLAGDWKKNVIPVMAKTLAQWPPVNKMAAQFAGKLYVDFTNESNYTQKIQELVKSINEAKMQSQ